MRKTRSKKNSFNWNKVQRFSIRKLSFGVASCMIGAQFVLSGLPNTVEAAISNFRDQKGGNITTLYANSGDNPFEAGGSGVYDKVNVDKEIGIQVDWSQYSKTNPYVKVTYKYNGGYGAEALNNYGGGRPDFWFTTPKGASEPTSIILKNLNTGPSGREMTSWSGEKPWVSFTNSVGSRYQNAGDADALNNGDPTKWERYNDSTKETGRTYRGDLNTMFWRRIGDNIEGSLSEQGIYQSFKDHTKTMYSDWQKAADPTATIEATYKVVDPTLKNGTLTLEFGAGVKVGHAGSLVTHFKTVTVEVPVLYKDSELFEVKVPERTGVGKTEALTETEKADIKEKIKKANETNTSSAIPGNNHNKFIDNLKDGEDNIVIGNDGTATITYLDGSQDKIPGTSLVYEKQDASKTETVTKGNFTYNKNPYPVDDINNIKNEEFDAALKNFQDINKMTFGMNDFGVTVIRSVNGVNANPFNGNYIEITKTKGNYYGVGSILSGNDDQALGTIPKEDLFRPKFDFNGAIEKGEKAIDALDYLSPKEKDALKNELATKTTQDEINEVVKKAIEKNSANESGIEAKKREIKDKINNAKYLTKDEKDKFLKLVDNQKITDDPTAGSSVTPLDYTKGLLDKIGQQVDAKNLEEAKKKAKAEIEKIKDDLTDPTADDYNRRIDNPNTDTTSKVEEIVTEAKKQKGQKDKEKAKNEADTLKEEYKKKIDQIPGLTDDQRTEYKKQIDNATSKGQLDNIIKDAEAAATRAKAIETINKLPHLNNAQKERLVERVKDATDKEEINDIVTEAQGLNSKMDSLQQLVTKANGVKNTGQYTGATEDKKNKFDTALTNADAVAKKAGREADASEVDKLIDELKKGIKGLTGTTEKTPVSKGALEAEINKADEVKNSPAYLKDTDEKRKAYDDALANAKTVLAKEGATQDEVNDALNKLQKARTELNGKATDFTLAVASGSAEISKASIDANTLQTDDDKNAVKAKLTVDNAAVKDTDTVNYGTITEKDGKKYVSVTVTRDGVSKEVQVEVVQKKETFQLELTDTKAVNISKDPVNGETLSAEDQAKVKEKIKDLKDGDKVSYSAITEKAGKKVVTVTVTRGTSTATVDVEVTKKATDFILVVVSGPAEISKASIDANTLQTDEDKNAVKAKLTVDNESVRETDKVEYGNITEKGDKKYVTVTVTRDGVSKEDKVEVVQKKEAFQVELNDTEAVNISKEPVNGETLSEADQAKVKAKIKDLKDGDDVSYSTITEKDGKKVVTVIVTRGTSKATVDVEVVHIKTAEEHAKKLKAPENKVKVTDTNHLTVKEKEAVKKAVADANPGLTEDKIKVDDQGYVETPLGNLEPKDVITSALNKPTAPVKVTDPSKLTKEEKDKVVEEIVKNNPDLADKKDKINVDDQGNVETPKGNLPAGDVVVPALKKPTTPVVVKNPDQLTNEEKEAVKDAIIAVNPDLAGKKDKINVDNQGNVETPNGNLPKEDVVTIVLNKPAAPVVVSNPNSLTDEEKDKVKDAVAKANPGLNKKDIEVDNQGNVKTPNGGLPAKDVITSNLNKPTAPVKVTDPSKLTKEEKDKVVEEIVKNNPDLAGKEDKINVDDQGNVETPKGNLPAGDVVTPVLNVPTKPIVVGNPESLTEKEKEAVKKAVADANPGLTEDKIKVDNQGNVVTPNGNIPAEYIVKASKGASVTRPDLPELSVQDALVAGVLTVKKGTVLTDDDILKQLTLVGDVTANVKSKPSTDTVGDFTAEVEITLADGSKKTVIVPVKVYEGERPEVNDLGKAKEDAKKQVEDAANKKIEEINKRTDLSDPEKTAAIEKVNKAKNDANTQIENATSAGTAKAIGEEAAKKITEFQPEHDSVKLVDPSKLDEEKAKAIAEIEQAAKNQTDSINNNKDLTPSQKEEAIKKIEELKAKAIEDVRKADTVDKVKDIVKNVEAAIKQVNPQPIPTPQPQPGGNTGGNSGNNTGNTSNQNAQANSDALANARKAAENILEEAARAKKAQLEEAGLSEAEKEELFAKVEAEKQAALDEIAKAKDVEEVKQLVMKAVAKIKAIQPARNAQDNQDSQEAQNAQNAQDAQNHSNSNPSSLVAANGRGQELPATGTGSEFVVFNAAAISILTGLGLAIPSKKKETEE